MCVSLGSLAGVLFVQRPLRKGDVQDGDVTIWMGAVDTELPSERAHFPVVVAVRFLGIPSRQRWLRCWKQDSLRYHDGIAPYSTWAVTAVSVPGWESAVDPNRDFTFLIVHQAGTRPGAGRDWCPPRRP
ncbi:hypothetical protein GCM10017788_19240 [Amycolatopsis acidiphila]|nr:hypothetical protein GCM10017788_19240 [Amycolatopsis acidiphila]